MLEDGEGPFAAALDVALPVEGVVGALCRELYVCPAASAGDLEGAVDLCHGVLSELFFSSECPLSRHGRAGVGAGGGKRGGSGRRGGKQQGGGKKKDEHSGRRKQIYERVATYGAVGGRGASCTLAAGMVW